MAAEYVGCIHQTVLFGGTNYNNSEEIAVKNVVVAAEMVNLCSNGIARKRCWKVKNSSRLNLWCQR